VKSSPTFSKILSAYAVVFAGVAPAILAGVGVWHGIGIFLLYNVLLGAAITYFGVRVFLGDRRAIVLFALLVVVHYYGLTISNAVNFSEFPEGSRAHRMALARAIRGVVFGTVYAWYYLLRKGTRAAFP
jgi:hypothetical protein